MLSINHNSIEDKHNIDHNPFAIPVIAVNYEMWYETTGHRAAFQEKDLLKRLLARFPKAQTILEAGCGTGYFTRWFQDKGLRSTGLDISAAMLREATKARGGAYLLGNALDLPFQTKSFDLVAFITTLEFLPDPIPAITEALRVAKLPPRW